MLLAFDSKAMRCAVGSFFQQRSPHSRCWNWIVFCDIFIAAMTAATRSDDCTQPRFSVSVQIFLCAGAIDRIAIGVGGLRHCFVVWPDAGNYTFRDTDVAPPMLHLNVPVIPKRRSPENNRDANEDPVRRARDICRRSAWRMLGRRPEIWANWMRLPPVLSLAPRCAAVRERFTAP
jgi:hypothetical protein